MAHLSTPPRLFVSPKGQRRIKDVITVNPYSSCTQLGSEPVRLSEILCPDTRCQTIDSIVRRWENLIQVPKWHSRHDRTKNLLLHYFHAWFDIDQHRWFNKIALLAIAFSTTEGHGTVSNARLQIARDAR